ncbi:MAG: sulfotransferase family protein [Jiangellaceae bacterium]
MRSAPPLPNFVVIGAMRSGSTSLYKYLQDHPQIFMPRKEIHFFDRKWDRGLDWYRSRFEGYAGEPAVGEATPTYLAEPVALDRMERVIPEARLVAILRNPVDRAYSHYWMERIRERERRSFEEAIAEETEGQDETDYLARGRYQPQLEEVCERFPRSRVLVALLDDLRDEPAATYAQVCRFLGVDDDFVPRRLGDRVNRFVAFRSMRLRRVRRSLPKLLRIGRIVGKLNAVEGGYPPMADDTRARLTLWFDDDNAALAKWLDRDLSAWRTDLLEPLV